MKNLLIISLFIIGIALESTIFPIPMVLILIIISLTYFDEYQANLTAFITGATLDLFFGGLLGLRSLFFLIILAFLSFYKKKLTSGSLVQRFLIIIFIVSVYYLFFYRFFNLLYILLSLILTICLYFLFERLNLSSNSKKRLSLN